MVHGTLAFVLHAGSSFSTHLVYCEFLAFEFLSSVLPYTVLSVCVTSSSHVGDINSVIVRKMTYGNAAATTTSQKQSLCLFINLALVILVHQMH